MEIANLMAVIGVKTSGFRAGMAEVDARMGATAAKMKAMDAQTAQSGVMLAKFGKAAAVGVVGGLAASVVAAMSFEKSMAQVRAVTDVTDTQFSQLRKTALALSSSVEGYGYSANDVAAAQTELGKAGLKVAQITGGGLRAALTLAKAGNLELGDAAAYTANAMQQFGLKGRDAQKVADALATGANATTADVGDFGAALVQTGAAARSAGLTFNETMTALTALAASGVKGSDAGTSLKTSLLQLINPTNKQEQAAKKAGMSFLDASGKMKDLGAISAMLRTRTADMTKAQRTALFATLAGTDGVRTLLSLYNAGPAALGRYSRELAKSGSAADMAAKMNDTTAARLERLKNQVINLGIEVGDALLPALNGIATAASSLVQAVGPAIKGLVTGLVSVGRAAAGSQTAMAALAAVIGAVAFTKAAAGAQALVSSLRGLAVMQGISAIGATVGTIGTAFASAATGVGRFGKAAQNSDHMTRSAAQAMTGFRGASQVAKQSLSALGTTLMGAMGGPIGMLLAGTGAAIGLFMTFARHTDSNAEAMNHLKVEMMGVTSAQAALQASTQAFTTAQSTAIDSRLRMRQAILNVKTAEQELASARASGDAMRIEQAEISLAMARRERGAATRAVASAENAMSVNMQKSVTGLLTLATQTGNTKARLTEMQGAWHVLSRTAAPGAFKQFQKDLQAVGDTSQSVPNRLMALQQSALKAAASIKGTSPAAKEAKAALEAIGNAKIGDLKNFSADIAKGLDAGKSKAQARKDAINNLIKSVGKTSTSMGGVAGQVSASLDAALATAKEKVAQINAVLRKIGLRSSPDVAQTVAGNIDNVAALSGNALKKFQSEVRTQAGRINADMRKSVDSSSLIGNFQTPPGLRDLWQQLKDIGAQQVAVSVGSGKRMRMVDGMSEALRISRELDKALKALDTEQGKDKKDKGRIASIQSRIKGLRGQAFNVQSQLGAALEGGQGLPAVLQAALDRTRQQLQAKVDSTYNDVSVRVGDKWQIVPGKFTQLQRQIDTDLKGVETLAKSRGTAIEKALRGSLVDGIDGLGTEFSGRIRALAERAKGLEALNDRNNLTPAEQRIKEIEDAAAAEDKARAMQEAQAKLAEAQRWNDADGITAAQKQIADLQRQDMLDGLRKDAETQRAERDKTAQAERDAIDAEAEALRALTDQRAQERRDDIAAQGEADRLALQQQQAAEQAQVEQHISDLQTQMDKIPNILFGSKKQQAQQLGAISALFASSGVDAGTYFRQNMAKELGKVDKAIVKVLANKVMALLKLNSPAKQGPLSTIDTWWDAMPKTLASGVNPNDLDSVAAGIAAPKFTAGRGGGSAATVINLTITDQTFAGMSRDQADRVARDIKAALDRQIGYSI